MNANERIQAVERFGFTTRQAGFLVAVMTHSGVCLPRQYAVFAGVAYGHKVNRFFGRLVARGFASACPSAHNRALVYHVQHRGLYEAIGEPHSRFRRPVPANAVAPRLVVLDAVISAPEVTRLATASARARRLYHARAPRRCALPSSTPPERFTSDGSASTTGPVRFHVRRAGRKMPPARHASDVSGSNRLATRHVDRRGLECRAPDRGGDHDRDLVSRDGDAS
ncbi:MAG TPA: hypothetical protein VGK32_14575 [Vicinamibacterales bacterium]|jgi:hypothetical protein